ncbi:ATP-grasp domain-containing protein [Archangium gephyra]|uniref:ATP-grasp domain-containing protein n=1 Tax=Archangium gephyra TaxID=48 RepID=UPI0035D46243
MWFNEGISAVHDALVLIREADTARELELLSSHSRPEAPSLAVADVAFPESSRMRSEEYVEWCLQTCRERGVDLFVPGRYREAISEHRARFEELGTRVLVAATPEVLALAERKDLFYASLEGVVPLPEYRVIRTLAEFDEAWAELRPRHRRLCIKPAVGIFGVGFHILNENHDAYEALIGGNGLTVAVDAFRSALAAAREPRRLLLMEYLPGLERSVDCLARDGTLIAAVSRRKRGAFQVLEVEGAAIELAAAIVAKHRLNGLVNVQTRDGRGGPRLLELNARMSGGMLYACCSGVNFPWWSVALALGIRDSSQVPRPQGDLLVAPTTGVRIVGHSSTTGEVPGGMDKSSTIQVASETSLPNGVC